MFSTIFQQVVAMSSARFVRNAFLPALVLSSALLVVYCVGTDGITDSVAWWNDRSATVKVFLALASMTWIFFLANVIANQWRAIVQLFEGYWGLGRWLKSLGVGWHETRRDAARATYERAWNQRTGSTTASTDEIWDSAFYYEYPASRSTPLLPTKLGNVLRAGESYPYERYGLDGPVIWPRLFSLLPDPVVTSTAAARSDLEFCLVFACIGLAFALISFVFLIAVDANLIVASSCYVGGLLIAAIGYRSSLAPATVYAEQMRVCFDLHRFELLDALQLERPTSPAAERELWKRVGALLYANTPQRWTFTREAADT